MNKVTQMTNDSGRAIPNQFIITTDKGAFFQSYDSIIVFIPITNIEPWQQKQKITLDEKFWNYSKTTGRYRNEFLGENRKETQAKIDKGIYKLKNLN